MNGNDYNQKLGTDYNQSINVMKKIGTESYFAH
jgi:hypothetical protein